MKEASRDGLEGKDPGLAQRLRFLRKTVLRLRQQELAERLGTTQTTLSNYEKPRRSPTADFLRRLQEEFYVDTNWLLTGRGNWRLEPSDLNSVQKKGLRRPIHPDDEELLDQIRRRLEERQGPSAFSQPVVVAMPRREEQPVRRPRSRDYRAIPYTASMSAIGKHPLTEEEIEGFFVVEAKRGGPTEHLRCLRLSDSRFEPTFPKGSILAVDVSALDTSDLDDKVVLAAWKDAQGDEKRSIARWRWYGERSVYEPVSPGGEAPERAEVELGGCRIVGKVVWAWHPVI